MGGQVLGGGVIVLVAVVLWLVYLVPSWYNRHQYYSAERNAVRLNQALRVLAETSETPSEVQLELNARTAAAQQRLARRAQIERERANLETARSELAAVRALPAARRARARRRARLITTLVGVAALALAGWGGWQLVQTGSQGVLWSSVLVAAVCAVMLRRMAHVGARADVRVQSAPAAPQRTAAVQDLAIPAEPPVAWTPRTLPRPLASRAGSRASAVLDVEAAHAALRQAALEESMRERVEQRRPPSIDTARVAREAAAGAEYRRMGVVDDAAIEAHVRRLLAQRAAG